MNSETEYGQEEKKPQHKRLKREKSLEGGEAREGLWDKVMSEHRSAWVTCKTKPG